MLLRKTIVYAAILVSSITVAQGNSTTITNNQFVGFGYTFGQTMAPLSIYPETKAQLGFDLTYGRTTFGNQDWAKLLNYPKTGVLLSYADFGNQDKVGFGITVMPFFEFGLLNSITNRMRFQVGLGGSYNNLIYDKVNNTGNHAVSKHLNWAFRSFLYYDVIRHKDFNIKIGAGLTHFSNGHTRWPNLGLNSYLGTVKTEFNFAKNSIIESNNESQPSLSNTQTYYTSRIGFGQKTLYRNYNSLKNVYTSSFGIGKIKNNALKYGLSLYYRFYEDYYDYIKEGDDVVNTNFPELTKRPFQNASALGLFADCEILINHFSVEAGLGVNLYKPAYKLDWFVNNGSYTNDGYIADEFGTKAKLKQYISSRLGLRYYAISAKKAPAHNAFVAATINANMGQADFSELSVGYVFCPKVKQK